MPKDRITAMEKTTPSEGGGQSLSNTTPLANGIPTPGTSSEAARADHVHPSTPSVTSVNGQTGTVKITADTVGALSLLRIPSSGNDYSKGVLALCDITNDNNSANRYFSGRVFVKRPNGISRPFDVILSISKLYAQTNAYISSISFHQSNNMVVTFRKNGRTYVGLHWTADASPYGSSWKIYGLWSENPQYFEYVENGKTVDKEIAETVQIVTGFSPVYMNGTLLSN